MSKSRSLLVGLGAAGALFGCRLLVQADGEQCLTDADCTGRAGALGLTRCVDSVCSQPAAALVDAGSDADAAPADPKWACLGGVRYGTDTAGEQIRIRTRLVKVIAETGIPDVVPKVCKSFDPQCTAPLSIGDTPSDADGYLSVLVPKWFDGFLELAPPASYPSMMPSILVLNPQDRDDDPNAVITATDSPHVYTIDELKFFLDTLGAPYDAELGHVTGQARDCLPESTSGVAFGTSTVGIKTVQIYLDGQAPSRTLRATTENGIVGFFNLPAGFQTVTYSLADGRRVGARTLFTRANWMTLATFTPTP